MLSRSCEYGLRAMIYLATKQSDVPVPISEIADNLGLSKPFLTKILQHLTMNNLLSSTKGVRGGVTLARSAENINLYEIIVAINGDSLFTRCNLGLSDCGHRDPCPMHSKWADLRNEIYSMYHTTILSEISSDVKPSDISEFDSRRKI